MDAELFHFGLSIASGLDQRCGRTTIAAKMTDVPGHIPGAAYHGPDRTLIIDTLDAPLIAPGKPALLNFTNDQPALAAGLHINLCNNVWGTNFPHVEC